MPEVKDNLYDLFTRHEHLTKELQELDARMGELRSESVRLVNQCNATQREIDKVLLERKKNTYRDTDWARAMRKE